MSVSDQKNPLGGLQGMGVGAGSGLSGATDAIKDGVSGVTKQAKDTAGLAEGGDKVSAKPASIGGQPQSAQNPLGLS